ncbi:DUF3592 domain-containing protein [Ectopseudomonas mendocina]
MAMKRFCALLLLALATLFLFGFLSSSVRTLWFVANAEVIPATVSAYRNVQRDPQRPPLYVAELAYLRDGQEMVASNHDSSRIKPFALGEQVTIYVDVDVPERAVIRDLSNLISTPLLALFLAYLFAWGSGVIYRSMPQSPEPQAAGKVDAFYARYGHYLKPTTLVLMLIFLPLVCFISVFTFLAQRLIPSLRRNKRDAEALVKALDAHGFFSLEHLPLPLPAFKKQVRDAQVLHLGNYRVCDSGSGSFAARVQSMAAWFGRRGVDLNVRVGRQPGELHYGKDGVLRLQGLDETDNVDSRRVDLALGRLFNRWLKQQGREERLYIPYPYGDLVMLSDALYRVLRESPVYPRQRLPLEIGTEGDGDITRLAKAQEHPLAWRYHRLFKLDADALGGLTAADFSTRLQQRLKSNGLRISRLLGESPQSQLFAVNDIAANDDALPQLLLCALSPDAYKRCSDIPDLDRQHGKLSDAGPLLPMPCQLSADNRFIFSENSTAIDALDLNSLAVTRIAEADECRTYMDLTLDESGRWLLFWFVNEDLDFPQITLYDLQRNQHIELDYQPLIDYRFDSLRWQRAPELFTVRNELTDRRECWSIDLEGKSLQSVTNAETTT